MRIIIVNNNSNADLQRVSYELYFSIKNEFSKSEYIQPFRQLIPPLYYGKNTVLIFSDPAAKNVLLIMLYRILGCRIIGGIHDVEGHDRKDKLKVKIYNLFLVYFCHGILLYSNYSRRKLLSLFGSVEKTYVYRFGATSGLEPIVASAEIKKTTADILYFGRVNEYSGKSNLRQIVLNCPNLNFLLMGAGMPDDVVDLENTEVIARRFSEEELKAALESCSTVMFPYVSATQSGGIHLAIHNKANIVFYDVGGLAEQLKSYPSFNVFPGNVDEFCKALRKAHMATRPQDKTQWLERLNTENKYELNALIREFCIDPC